MMATIHNLRNEAALFDKFVHLAVEDYKSILLATVEVDDSVRESVMKELEPDNDLTSYFSLRLENVINEVADAESYLNTLEFAATEADEFLETVDDERRAKQ